MFGISTTSSVYLAFTLSLLAIHPPKARLRITFSERDKYIHLSPCGPLQGKIHFKMLSSGEAPSGEVPEETRLSSSLPRRPWRARCRERFVANLTRLRPALMVTSQGCCSRGTSSSLFLFTAPAWCGVASWQHVARDHHAGCADEARGAGTWHAMRVVAAWCRRGSHAAKTPGVTDPTLLAVARAHGSCSCDPQHG